jgi:hypothetical protein
VAFRLSTVGSTVLDGKGLGVSEAEGVSLAVAVGVLEAISLGAGIVTGSVTVGGAVPAEVGWTGVDVEMQANAVSIHRIGKMSFRLIA